MDEADQKLRWAFPPIKSSQGRPMLMTGAMLMTEAKRLARNAVKVQWQAQGRKVPHVPYIELVNAARDYVDSHRDDLVSQARANLSNYVQRKRR